MANIMITSVQQYTIDRIRVGLYANYDTSQLNNVTIRLFGINGDELSDRLKSVSESNADKWADIGETNIFDVYLQKNTLLEAGEYRIVIYDSGVNVYSGSFTIGYMEDVRVSFGDVIIESLNKIRIPIIPLDQENLTYQSVKMLRVMKLSLMDENGTDFTSTLTSLEEIVSDKSDDDVITELELSVRDTEVIPKGSYTLRFTSVYKSRTFSIVEKAFTLPFITNNAPEIANCYISINADLNTNLTIVFKSYLEKSMFLSSNFSIIMNETEKDVTSHFNSIRIATQSITSAGIDYITRLDIPLISDLYTLEKGSYTVNFKWDTSYINDISYNMNCKWFLHEFDKISLHEVSYLHFALPEELDYSILETASMMIELNGEVYISDVFASLVDSNIITPDTKTSTLKLNINKPIEIPKGIFTFIFYYEREAGEVEYLYGGDIDIIGELTPNVESVTQTDVDTIHVKLSKAIPIKYIEKCVPHLADEFDGSSYDDKLQTIRESNLWEPDQTMADMFEIMVGNDANIPSGNYLFHLSLNSDPLKSFPLKLQYMEKAKGVIDFAIQTDLTHIEISFSKPQSRKFLLSTKLCVERKSDGADFSDRFELLENILKADEYIITKLIVPMDNEDSLPGGIYTISFKYKLTDTLYTTAYAYDTELGYMSSNIPEISTVITSKTTSGKLSIKINFGQYLEESLFNSSEISLINPYGQNVINDFELKRDCTTVTTTSKSIQYVKSLMLDANSTDIHFERGMYLIKFSWEDSSYKIPDVTKDVFLEYSLPYTVEQEVSSYDSMKNAASLYFKFDTVLQYSFFEDLKVEVLNENGVDHTEYFSSIQDSNGISSSTPEEQKISTDNINLDIINVEDISYGVYTIVFYHEKDGVRESHYMSKIDICAALVPGFLSIEQVGIDSLLINLKGSVPRMLLESYTVKFESFGMHDISNYFKTIDASNDWAEDVRHVSSFYLKLKNGYIVEKDDYLLTLFAGNVELDSIYVSIERMEGVAFEISSVNVVNLNTLMLSFSNEQTTTLFKTFSLIVETLDGVDVSDKFQTISESLTQMDTDFFESLDISVTSDITKGSYTFTIVRFNSGIRNDLCSYTVDLPYMSEVYPMLYEVSSLQTSDGDSAITMWFSPALELSLYSSARFFFTNISGIDMSHKLVGIENSVLDTEIVNDITYVNHITIDFKADTILDKGDYVVSFNWDESYADMKNLSRNVSLDYIILPVESVTVVDMSTVRVTFKESHTGEYLKKCELKVDSIYEASNGNGNVITDVDFSNLFTIDTSNLVDAEVYYSVDIKLVSGGKIPNGRYRFIISEYDDSVKTMVYAYGGNLLIEYMENRESASYELDINQTSLNTVSISFKEFQNVDFFNTCEFTIMKGDVDYSRYFKPIEYVDYKESEIIVDTMHYTEKIAKEFVLTLDDDKAIPAGLYILTCRNSSSEIFSKEFSVLFMTSTPAKIVSMGIEEKDIVIRFDPYAEESSLLDASFKLACQVGIDSLGNIIEKDVSDNLAPVSNIRTNVISANDIRYINEVYLPIKEKATLASGKYTFYLNWHPTYFMKPITFSGGLSILAIGIKSAYTIAQDKIKIEFNEDWSIDYLNDLNLSVIDISGNDCTDLFQSIEDSNKDITAGTDVNAIQIYADKDVLANTYTFTLSERTYGLDGELTLSPKFQFEMCITYLSPEFSTITKVDNFSNEKFEIITITNANASAYYGYYVQLTTSTVKELLTESNIHDYLNKEIKIFAKASIDRLTLKFNDEIHACLLTACDVSISDDEGKVYSDKFNTITESNVFTHRTVLDYITIEFPESHTGEYYESLDVTVKKKDGTDISALFDTIAESNELDNNESTSIIKIRPGEDECVEEVDLIGLQVGVVDGNNSVVSRVKYNVKTTRIATVNQIDLILKDGECLPSKEYSISLSYQNEPSVENSANITPFTYSGILPFLSSNIGYITSIEQVSLSKLAVSFSEDLPTALFSDIQLEVLDEDGEHCDSLFTSISESNNLEGTETISELSTPFTLYLELAMGETLKAGKYTIQFTTDICANSEDVVDETEPDEEDTSGIYTLWKYTTSISYMVKEMQNVIRSVKMSDIDTLKFELERPVDISLLRDYAITAKCESSGYIYDTSSFKDIKTSNNFGLYVMLSESRYVFYSETGSSWNQYDTGFNIDLSDIIYDSMLKKYIIVGSQGKVLMVESFKSIADATEISTSVNKNLNSIVKVANRYIVVGNEGTILVGTIGSDYITWDKVESGVSNTLTKVIALSDNEVLAVGYSGIILYSKDCGITWEKVIATNTSINLTSAIQFTQSEVALVDTEESGSEKYRNGVYIIGTKGTLLYSPNGHYGWEQISINTKASLFGITSHDNKIVIVGEVGTVVTTDDMVNWSVIDSGISVSLRNVAYCDTQYYACGSNGKWITSNSGNSWTVNSTIFGNSFRNILFTPSQYVDNRKASYFYMKLATDETLGAVNFFRGTEVPTLENYPASNWTTDKLKDVHIGDIYTRYETLNGITNNMEMYQFGTNTIIHEDGTMTSGSYRWISELEGNIYTSFSTDYEFEIVTSDGESMLLESGEKAIQPIYGVPITYMTSNPGVVQSVEICSPDAEDSIEYEFPYIKVNLTNGDENAIYYARFSVTDKNGKDYTNYFKSLRHAGFEYESDFVVKTVFIYGNASIVSLPSGEYTFEWIWFDTTKISKTFHVKNMSQLINTVDKVSGTSNLNVIFNDGKTLPLEFFVTNNQTLDIQITKMPMTENDDVSYNFYQKFKDVLESTEFSDPDVCVDGNVKRFTLSANDHTVVKSGVYMMKLRNEKNPTETEDTMLITTHKFTLSQELINEQPVISSVNSLMRSKTVQKIDTTAPIQYYEGNMDPSYSDTLTSNWRSIGETELLSHVGDIYTNTESQKSFSFCYLNDAGIYNWVQNTSSPYLVVTMGSAKPTFNSIISYVAGIQLHEIYSEESADMKDITQYLKSNVNDWEFDFVNIDDIKYVSKIYIPFDTEQNFPGASNATFKINWTSEAPYSTMQISKLSLPMITKDYGTISKVVATMISDRTETMDETYGIYVEFSHVQHVSFLKECTLSMTHEILDGSGNVVIEDVAGLFNSIEDSNEDNFKGVTTTNHLWLTLPETQVIEPGTYTLEISGYKPIADLSTGVDETSIVSFSHETHIPYVSNIVANDCIAKVETGVSGYAGYPILTISFLHTSAVTSMTTVHPDKTDFNTWSLKVTEQATGIDVSDRFRPYTSSLIGFTYAKSNPNRVKSIHIPLKQAVALNKGTYDISFTFDKASIFGTVPTKGKLDSFTLAEPIITKVGNIAELEVLDDGKKVAITTEFFDSVNTEAKLKESSIGKVLGIKTYTQLFKKMNLEFVNGSGNHRETYLKSPKYSGNKITYTIKDNHKINPCNMTVRYRYSGSVVFKAKTFTFKGMIRNVVGGALKDKVCYVLLEKHDGVSKRRVYKSYKALQNRINKLKKLNSDEKSQCAICKSCRKCKLLQTKTIKAPIEKYSFRDGKRVALFKKMSVWYYKNLLAKTTKCKNIAFVKFNDVTDDAYDKIHCDNYMKKATTYTWSLEIATMGTKFPAKGKPVHLVWINKRGIELVRGFEAGKDGKKSSVCKKYKKNKIDKHITKYKNKVSSCAKCKKCELAIKGSSVIGWNSARFPIALKNNSKYAKQITKLVNKLYKTKAMGGCKKAKFSLVKHNNTLCKLSCSNTVIADKELSSGIRKATMSK